jgi:hypothetical protein
MDTWPITINGEIYPAHRSFTQWEIGHCDKSKINELPLNPYGETVGTLSEGIQIECQYKNTVPVIGRFHRHKNDKGIWIYANRSKGGPSATDKWYKFISSFGIVKGIPHENISVYLDFYPKLVVVVR